MTKYIRCISGVEILLGVICFIYYIICLAAGGKGISILYAWWLIGAVLCILGITGLIACRKKAGRVQKIYVLFDTAFLALFLTFVIFAGLVIGDMKETADRNCDYIIVLGAAVNGTEPTEVLQKRIDAAYGYLIENENAKVIGTGGQGTGEEISEGQCIANELEKMGIEKERILYEEKSTTTVENIRFALEKITDKPQCIAVVSSGFHIFRSKLILRDYTDASVYGISARGTSVFTLHYILREYIVLIIDLALGNYGL